MVSSGRSQLSLALLSALLLTHTAAAARLHVAAPAEELGDFDVLGNIQTEVDKMNTNLGDLSEAIAGIPEPTEEPTTQSPTEGPTQDDLADLEDERLQRLFISRNFLTLEVHRKTAGPCDPFMDVEETVNATRDVLDLVSQKQLSNSTLEQLIEGNSNLTSTIACVNNGNITLDSDEKASVQSVISIAEKSGEAASDTINNIVDPTVPPTSPPEDDSGFRAATIALGVLFALSLVAVAGLSIYAHRQKSGGH